MEIFDTITDTIGLMVLASALLFVFSIAIKKYLPEHYQNRIGKIASAAAMVCKICFVITIFGMFIYLIMAIIKLKSN